MLCWDDDHAEALGIGAMSMLSTTAACAPKDTLKHNPASFRENLKGRGLQGGMLSSSIRSISFVHKAFD